MHKEDCLFSRARLGLGGDVLRRFSDQDDAFNLLAQLAAYGPPGGNCCVE